METSHIIVWVIFGISSVILVWFFGGRVKKDQALKKSAQQQYNEKMMNYSYLKPGALDECPRDDVTAAALFHCIRKEEDNFEDSFEKFNYSEKVVYGIYQLSNSIQGKNPSIQSFFISPATRPYVPFIDKYFEEIGAHEIAELVVAARRFAEIIENDEEDDEDMGDYSRYNFADFTNEYAALVTSTNVTEKLTEFILNHKEDFYDYDIPNENEGD